MSYCFYRSDKQIMLDIVDTVLELLENSFYTFIDCRYSVDILFAISLLNLIAIVLIGGG